MEDLGWARVDHYVEELLLGEDPPLTEALRASNDAGLPAIAVSPAQGKFLYLLARAMQARSILEIGTLAGYSTIWLARALPPGGRLITLELHEKHARIARDNLARAGLAAVVDVQVGPATDSLARLAREAVGPFDFIFIDADKASYTEYLKGSLKLSRPGTVVVADNVVRDGQVTDETSTDANVTGAQRFNAALARETRVSATILQTVGVKGYDGFAIGIVQA